MISFRGFLISIAVVLVVGGITAAGGFLYFLYTAPRMREQAHVRAYQAVVPLPPRGSVPARKVTTLKDSAAALSAQVPVTGQGLENGRAYYTYYCIFCHGVKGDGRGPVGESYAPAPADLRSDRVRRAALPRLLEMSLKGVGHDPVLEKVVHPEYRRDLILYVRALAQTK